jgi:rhamnulokinase
MNQKAQGVTNYSGSNNENKQDATAKTAVPRDARAIAAVDMGAESCRVSLLRWAEGRPEILIVHRFPNAAVEGPAGLTWDIEKIISGIEDGLRACAELAPEGIASVGVDSWAVDYVRLAPDGKPLANPFCYRDERNTEAERQVYQRIPADRLYALTGIQLLRFNTIFQLYADQLRGVPGAVPWVNLPEYVLHRLGGRRVAEYTNATHTQLVALGRKTWCQEIFETVGLDLTAAPPIVPPGTDLGNLRGPLSALPAFRNTRLIAPACHDTASAIAGIPATGDDWGFLSSGTWSLIGALLDAPCVTAEAGQNNYTNLGGVGGKICFLKNVNGMWLISQCLEEWARAGKAWAIADLVTACESVPAPGGLLDVDDPDLLLPGGMPTRVNAQRIRAGLAPLSEFPEDAPAIASLIFHSLAARYAALLRDVAAITGKKLNRLFVVGGGSRNGFLNRLTMAATGLELIRGPVESSTVGNLAIQVAALQGAYDGENGVSGKMVARWAEVLGAAEFKTVPAAATSGA